MTLTFRNGRRLDCVEEGLDQSCHEACAGVVICCVLVLGLGEAMWDCSCWTDILRRDRLGQADPQHQHSYPGLERSSAALPPPTAHNLTYLHVYR